MVLTRNGSIATKQPERCDFLQPAINEVRCWETAAEKQFDLSRLPASVTEVRVVEIEGFDKTPCKDPHVENTREVGIFKLLSVSRVGKDRYRFIFQVRQKT